MTEKKQTYDKIFLDSNILIYLYSADEIQKSNVISNLLQSSDVYCISTQVLNEFAYVSHRKKKIEIDLISKSIQEMEKNFEIAKIELSTIRLGLSLIKKYKYSYFDSLIIATAIENECSKLYTEDLHNKHIIDSLQIINPFTL